MTRRCATTSCPDWTYKTAPLVRRLRGATFAVLGLGRIGLATARRAAAFDMKVIFHDPYLSNGTELAVGYERVRSLEEFMARADILSVHTPLTEETRGLVGARTLAHAKPELIVINTARGPIVDLDALADALREGRIAGAGLDVLPQEPADVEPPADRRVAGRRAVGPPAAGRHPARGVLQPVGAGRHAAESHRGHRRLPPGRDTDELRQPAASQGPSVAVRSPSATTFQGCPMRITEIETFAVGAGWKNWLFVKVHTDAGLHGIGEGTLNGFIRTTEAGIRELEHLVIGQDPCQVRALAKRMLDSVSLDGGHIHRTVIAAIEVACWDILGKSLGAPIHQLLGGRMRDSVLGYANGWYRTERTPEAFLAAAKDVIAKGFKAFKLDPFGTAQGFISEPELALAEDILATLRRELPADTRILIDVHARFTEVEAIRAARRLAPLDLYWWEEPTTRDRQETVHPVGQRQPYPRRDRRDVRHGRPVLHAGGRRRRQHLPAGADVARGDNQHACRRRYRARPWQLHRPPPERRAGGDGSLPAACRLRAELPHPGAFRRLQRSRGRTISSPGARPSTRRTATCRFPTRPASASTSMSMWRGRIPTTPRPI